jgi:mediator of replication checkpoint protein 1
MSTVSPPHPAPQRTYGRARPASPTEDVPSLFTSATPRVGPEHSPSRALLNRWSTSNATWRDSLAQLDVPSQKQGEQEDAETVKRAMEAMRKQARGLVVESLPDPLEVAARKEQNGKVSTSTASKSLAPPRYLFTSSSLTDLPATSTPPRSSPSPASPRDTRAVPPVQEPIESSSSILGDERMPSRKSGTFRATGRARRIVDSSDEEGGLPSTKSLMPVTRPRPHARSIRASSTEGDVEGSPPQPRHRRCPGKARASSPASKAEDDTPRAGRVQDFFATLSDEDDKVEDVVAHEPSAELIADPTGLFSDGEDKRLWRKVSGPKVCSASLFGRR